VNWPVLIMGGANSAYTLSPSTRGEGKFFAIVWA
jgi:hypothetical protein